MSIYFDNSATTPVLECAAKAAYEAMINGYANPSSLHSAGIKAERQMEKSRKIIADALHASPNEITFTSCATESSNLAIFGAYEALKRRGSRVVTTTVEHPSVYECFKKLESMGAEVIYVSPRNGKFEPEDFYNAINKDTILVSVMYVNNETGDILPVDCIRSAIQRAKAPALFHCDCVQAFGKTDIRPEKLGIDMISLSAHKLYGPKGVGALYLRKGARIVNRNFGGGQERGLRSGTENTAGIAAFGEAVNYVFGNFKAIENQMRTLHDYFMSEAEKRPFITVNSPENGANHIISISLLGCRSETVLHCLEEKDIFVSSGSACSSHGGEGKRARVMTEYGFSPENADSAVRISFGIENTIEEIDVFMKEIEAVYDRLKR